MSASTAAPGALPRASGELRLEGVGKTFVGPTGATQVLGDVSLVVAPGEFVSIVGPSGAGKTTLLRCIAGLHPVSAGRVIIDDQIVERPPARLGVVFQDYGRSLMPWFRVGTNVALPLRNRGVPRSEAIAAAEESLEAVGLVGVTRLYPWQLSGGMQQRVAIARALAYDPTVLLLDEPFASVDAQTRADLEDLVLRLRDRFGLTIVLVTHDIDEAIYVGNRVVVLSGRPAEVTRDIRVDIDDPRSQLETKSLPRFSELRIEVARSLMRQPESLADTGE